MLICKGVRGLYDGLTGTLLRQMTYSMMRFAAYDWAKGVVHTGMSVERERDVNPVEMACSIFISLRTRASCALPRGGPERG